MNWLIKLINVIITLHIPLSATSLFLAARSPCIKSFLDKYSIPETIWRQKLSRWFGTVVSTSSPELKDEVWSMYNSFEKLWSCFIKQYCMPKRGGGDAELSPIFTPLTQSQYWAQHYLVCSTISQPFWNQMYISDIDYVASTYLMIVYHNYLHAVLSSIYSC